VEKKLLVLTSAIKFPAEPKGFTGKNKNRLLTRKRWAFMDLIVLANFGVEK